MEARGQQLAARTIEALEHILTEHAVDLVNSLARAHKVSPYHVALQVPGLCHSHGPDRRVLDGRPGSGGSGSGQPTQACAFCVRRGNCFA